MQTILRTAAAGLAIASLGIASSASAVTAEANARAEILESLTLEVVTGDDMLDFGLIADNGAGGSVDVTAGSNVPVCSGDLVCSGTGASPSFTLEGEPGLWVGISFTDSTPQLSDGGTETMDYSLNTPDSSIQLDTNGDGGFDVGGSLTVAAGQAAGVYTGTFEVVAVYE